MRVSETMDANELATNAELNYWPPHLGVTTDAEKIAYLAQQLNEAANRINELESELAEREECTACKPCEVHNVE